MVRTTFGGETGGASVGGRLSLLAVEMDEGLPMETA